MQRQQTGEREKKKIKPGEAIPDRYEGEEGFTKSDFDEALDKIIRRTKEVSEPDKQKKE